jgi:hypothetical protein
MDDFQTRLVELVYLTDCFALMTIEANGTAQMIVKHQGQHDTLVKL